ncbi:MAG: putative FAD-linked oxidoreductase [Firmicutes bacterium ADurb.Bin248]|nr:MAG: putative FAD-linked oxidoreductase [Firmicutes bacterium ADurb.Bin248]HOF99650.1 FAD-binding oxidoreductase [Clostridia bacterium]HPK15707.1 FAD-binding oxidoreductase [Clostridia bacterium]
MSYSELNAGDLAFLEGLLTPARLLAGEAVGEDYCHDEMNGVSARPGAVCFAQSVEEISAVMRHAYRRELPVVVRGSGSGLVGGAVALCGGIMIVTTGMNRILELDLENLTLTVEPGVLLMDIVKYLDPLGLFYPPDPGEKSATIGGNIATNAGGMRAVKYGVTRDYIRALTCVLPDGEVIRLGGKTVKTSSGYDLKDLVCGSEGTLAVVAQAVLKLLPKPRHTVSLLVPYADYETAIASVPRIVASRATPTAVEFMERRAILMAQEYLKKGFPDTDYPAYLLMTFDGSTKAQVCADYEAAASLCLDELGAEDVFVIDTEERYDMVWSARGVLLEAIKASTGEMDECDVVVPRSSVAELLAFAAALSEKHGLRMPSFGHAGDGNMHIYLCRDELDRAEFERRKGLVFDELYEKARALGGQVSGEHGIGCAKRPYLMRSLGREYALMRGIKRVFDEKNILNPGKVI